MSEERTKLNQVAGSECECKTCFDYPQYCKLHQCWQDDPKHQYEYPACEQNMENRTCPDCGQSFIQNTETTQSDK